MTLDDDLFPIVAICLGVITVAIALRSPDGEGKIAAIAVGSNLVGVGGGAYCAKLKYGRGYEEEE